MEITSNRTSLELKLYPRLDILIILLPSNRTSLELKHEGHNDAEDAGFDF